MADCTFVNNRCTVCRRRLPPGVPPSILWTCPGPSSPGPRSSPLQSQIDVATILFDACQAVGMPHHRAPDLVHLILEYLVFKQFLPAVKLPARSGPWDCPVTDHRCSFLGRGEFPEPFYCEALNPAGVCGDLARKASSAAMARGDPCPGRHLDELVRDLLDAAGWRPEWGARESFFNRFRGKWPFALGDPRADIPVLDAAPCGGPTGRPGLGLGQDLPAMGMISPAQQWCIQIELTNACPHRCSNCTRFTSHIREPFFMDLDTFRRAVDSMAGFEGMLGIMGGEPTLHPEFERFVAYYRDRWHPAPPLGQGRLAISDFGAYHARCLADPAGRARGLWTGLGPSYYAHYEAIQETFGYQCINLHQNDAMHQALLVTRKELGIGDADWQKLRDACWVQRLWSASITPRGAFFCEVAAALDVLYDGPGGFAIEPGWWKRTPADFGSQLDWCELCGAALPTPTRLATDQIQDVSPEHLTRLQEIGSPAIAAGRVQVLDLSTLNSQLSTLSPRTSDWYMPAAQKARRAGTGTAGLGPRRIEVVVVSVGCGEELRLTLPTYAHEFDRVAVVTASCDAPTQQVARDNGALLVVSDACYADDAAMNKGRMLNAGIEALDATDWILLTDADIFFPPGIGARLKQLVLNPGCLYYTRRFHLAPDIRQPDWARIGEYDLVDEKTNHAPWGFFELMNVRASTLKGLGGLRFPGCFCSAGSIDQWFCAQWPPDKVISLPWADRHFDVLHLWHGEGLGVRWNGSLEKQPAGDRWRWSSQSNFADLRTMERGWPAPCLVRRTAMHSCEQSTILYLGGRSVWPAPSAAAERTLWEYSVKAVSPVHRWSGPETESVESLRTLKFAYRPTYDFPGPHVNAAHQAIAALPREHGMLKTEIDGWLTVEDALKLYEMAFFAGGPILEIGVHHGLSTTFLARAVRDSGRGNILESIEQWEANAEAARKNLADRGLPGTVRVGDSSTVMSTLPTGSQALIFVDGDHTYEGVTRDCPQVIRLLEPGGFALFHDFASDWNADPAHLDTKVWQAMRDVAPGQLDYWGAVGWTGIFRKPG